MRDTTKQKCQLCVNDALWINIASHDDSVPFLFCENHKPAEDPYDDLKFNSGGWGKYTDLYHAYFPL